MTDSIPSTPDKSGEPKPECGQVMESHLRGALYCTKPKGHWRDPDIMVRAHSNGVSMWPAYEDKVGGATCGYPVVGDGAACVLPADHEGECTAEELAPSGEPGVPTETERLRSALQAIADDQQYSGDTLINQVERMKRRARTALALVPTRQTVWLIERGQRERQTPPLWLRAAFYDEWVEDANSATHFATREAAVEEMRRRGHKEDCGPTSVPRCEWGHVTEHVFLDNPRDSTPICYCENGLGLPHSLHEFCTPVSSLHVTPPSPAENRPVSSPEKPELIIDGGLSLLDSIDIAASSSLPTDEEVEGLADALKANPPVTMLCGNGHQFRAPASDFGRVIFCPECCSGGAPEDADELVSSLELAAAQHPDNPLHSDRIAAAGALKARFASLHRDLEEAKQRAAALYTGLTEVQQERDGYHREASKALAALEEARKGIAPLIEPVYHSEHGREWWEVLGVRHAGIVAAQDHAAAANAFAAMYTRELRRPRCSLEQSLETAERERDEARKDSERIDWLASRVNRGAATGDGEEGTLGHEIRLWIRRQRGHESWPKPFTLREAIDAARTQ